MKFQKAVFVFTVLAILVLTLTLPLSAQAACDSVGCKVKEEITSCNPIGDEYSTVYCAGGSGSWDPPFTRLDTGVSCSTAACPSNCELTYWKFWTIECGTCCFDGTGPEPTPVLPTCDTPTNPNYVCNSNGTVTLSWTNDPDSGTYSLRLNDQTDGWDTCPPGSPNDWCFENILEDASGTTSYTAPINIAHTYNWWVHGVNGTCYSSALDGGQIGCGYIQGRVATDDPDSSADDYLSSDCTAISCVGHWNCILLNSPPISVTADDGASTRVGTWNCNAMGAYYIIPGLYKFGSIVAVSVDASALVSNNFDLMLSPTTVNRTITPANNDVWFWVDQRLTCDEVCDPTDDDCYLDLQSDNLDCLNTGATGYRCRDPNFPTVGQNTPEVGAECDTPDLTWSVGIGYNACPAGEIASTADECKLQFQYYRNGVQFYDSYPAFYGLLPINSVALGLPSITSSAFLETYSLGAKTGDETVLVPVSVSPAGPTISGGRFNWNRSLAEGGYTFRFAPPADCCTPPPKTWQVDPSIACTGAGEILYVENSDLEVRPYYNLIPIAPTPTSTVWRAWENEDSTVAQSVTAYDYNDLMRHRLRARDNNLPIPTIYTLAALGATPAVASPVNNYFEWDYNDAVATYDLVYEAPSAWCCLPSAPTGPDLNEPSLGQVLIEYETEFDWDPTNFGSDCGLGAGVNIYDVYVLSSNSISVPSGGSSAGCTAGPSDCLLAHSEGEAITQSASVDFSGITPQDGINYYWVVVARNGSESAESIKSPFSVDNETSNWYQTAAGDVYADGSIGNNVPLSCSTDFFSEATGISDPGFVYCPGSIDIGDGPGISEEGWSSDSGDQNLTNYYSVDYFYDKLGSPGDNISGSSLDDAGLDTLMGASKSIVLYNDGGLTLDGLTIAADESVIIFVRNGDVTITGELLTARSGAQVGFLGVFGDQDILVDESVQRVQGIYFAESSFDTCASGTGCVVNQFQGEGVFTALGGFNLDRVHLDVCTPAELFTYRPEYVLFAPVDFWRLPQTWQEKAP